MHPRSHRIVAIVQHKLMTHRITKELPGARVGEESVAARDRIPDKPEITRTTGSQGHLSRFF
jgi:hypothetical protein